MKSLFNAMLVLFVTCFLYMSVVHAETLVSFDENGNEIKRVSVPKTGDLIIFIQNTPMKTDKEEVGTVPAGAVLEIKEINTVWYWVQYEGKKGWVINTDVMSIQNGLEHFSEMITTSPGLGNYIYRSNIYIALKRWDDAKNDCTSALSYDAENAIALSNRALCFMNLKNMDAALEDANRVLNKNGQDVNSLYIKGTILQNKQDFKGAITQYDSVIKLNPNFINAYFNRSTAHTMLKLYDKAIDDLNQMLKILPDDTKGLNYRGYVYFVQGKYDDALKDFTKIISINPQFVDAYSNRASVYNEKKDYANAIKDTETVIKLNPENYAAYNNRGFAMQQTGKYAEAVSDYEKALSLNKNFYVPWRNLADLYLNSNKPEYKNIDKALDAGNKACELSARKDWKSLRNLAAVHAAKNDFVKAREILAESIPLVPDDQKELLTKLAKDYEEKIKK